MMEMKNNTKIHHQQPQYPYSLSTNNNKITTKDEDDGYDYENYQNENYEDDEDDDRDAERQENTLNIDQTQQTAPIISSATGKI